MVHIFLGIIAIIVGIFLMINNWWAFLDLFWVILPLILILGGSIALVAGLTSLISGKYSDKIKENELIIVLGYSIMGIGFLLYFWVNSVIFLFIVQAIIGIGEAIYSPAFDSVYSKNLNSNKFGRQWGAWESMNYFTTAFGAITGGGLVTLFGFQTLFVVMSVLCFGSAFYIYHLKRSIL